MTSLSRQLSRLRVPQTSVHKEKRGSISFLYDFLEAKSIDSDTHFAIAVSGLQSLIQLDPSIARFSETLFNESSKTLDRALLTIEANQDLDTEIESFLFSVVSKYFLLNSTHKTIEWLIYRYGVNQYNVDPLIVSVMPYHETRLFARLLQTCADTRKSMSQWFWLKPIQRNGCPLPKSALITHCISEPTFLRLICDNLIKCLKIDDKNNNFLTFFMSTLINITEKTTNESILSIIVSIIIKGLKSKNDSLRKSSLCIYSHLCSRIQLDPKVLDKTLRAITKRFNPLMSDEIILTLTIIDRFQHLEDLPLNLINYITETNLIECQQKYEIQNLISLILKSLLKNFTQNQSNEKLISLLDKISLTSLSIDTCVQTISKLIENNSDDISFELFSKVLSLLELRYPNLFDASLSKLDSLTTIAPFLGAFRFSLLKDSKIPMIFGLTHINQSVQKEAIDYLIENFDVLMAKKDDITVNSIKTLLSDALSVKTPEILITIFGLKEKMFKIFSEEEIKEISHNLLVLCNTKEKNGEEVEPIIWNQLKNSIIATFCSINTNYSEGIHSILYPFLFPLNESDLITLSIIMNSNIAKEIEIFVKLSTHCKQLIEGNTNLKDVNPIVVSICTEIANYFIENQNLIRKNTFILSPQSVDYLKSSVLSLMILERIHYLSSDPSIKQKSATILLSLIEILLKSQKMSKPKKSIELFESCIKYFVRNLRKLQLNTSNIIYLFQSVIKSMDLSNTSTPEKSVWFWFKQFNSDNYFYKLFLMLFNNCYNNNENKSIAFRNVFINFVRKMFKRIGYDFFAPLWANDKSVLLQSRSLIISSHFTKPVLQFSQITVLSSLIVLHSTHCFLRNSALDLIKNLKNDSNDSFIDHCLKDNQLIRSDDNSISYAIAQWVSSNSDSLINEWICLLDDDNCPQHIKSGIVLLLNKSRIDLLRKILTKTKTYLNIKSPNSYQIKTIECLLSIYSDSNVFENISSETDIIFEFFINSLKSKTAQKMTIDLINKSLFDAIPTKDLKIEIINQLLDININNFNKNSHKKLRKLLKCGDLISSLLNNLVPNDESGDNSEPKPKRILFNDSEFSLESNNWKKFIILLEIIQSKSHLINISVLVKNLFIYLKNTFIMNSKSSLEYLRQLLLNSLINCMKQSEEDIPFSQIESIIECLRESQQKETQKLALILISCVAHRFKKEILDSVITIFTFIGTNLLHCDDQYSIQIVFDIMEAILPILLTDANDTKETVINVFIDSLSDIPSHRRLILFHKLLEMLGESQHLSLIFMKVIERVFNKSKSEKEPFLSLIVALSSQSDIKIQINSINQLMDVFNDEFCDQKNVSITDKNFTENQRKLIAHNLAQIIFRIVSSQEFIDTTKNSEWEAISDLLLGFLHRLIVLIVKYNSIQSSDNESNSHPKRIRIVLLQILLQFNSILPNEQLIELVLQLLRNDSFLIQRKAFELLNEKLVKVENQSLDIKHLENLLKTLLSMVPTAESANQMDEQHIYNSQLSMITCKLLSKHIGDNERLQDLIFKILQQIVSLVNGMKPEIPINFKASCIICMIQLMTCLANKAIPLIPSIVPIILENFGVNDEVIIISNITSISKLTQNYPQFMSPYLDQILIQLLSTFNNCPQIKSRLNSVWNTFAKMIPKRVLMTSIDSTFDEISNISAECLSELMSLLKQTFENINSNSDVNTVQKFVKSLMTKALNLRNKNSNKLNTKQMEELENCCNEAFSVFIPKLTEVTFRPLFYKLYDCAIRENNGKLYHRMISFYKLMNVLAHKLKSLFCIFVGPSIVNNCSQILSLFHSDNELKPVLNNEDTNLLIVSMLSTLSNCFLYDINGAFLNKERMQALVRPIINQLSNTLGTEEHYNKRIDYLCLCTQYLIESNKDETIIKDFNYQILLKTRDTSSHVRLAALQVLRRLILVSGEDYLPIIPETIPFISELSEDDSNSIEDFVKTIINDLEQILGEPITKYL